jgi:glycosyltransferase involved in cell wall biosynthesis
MSAAATGVVVIGRNEGARLERCLASVAGRASRVVYVDSGSTDGSVAMARSAGVEVVELDMSIQFTAARARNAGFEHLQSVAPDVRYVQFVDGDCEIVTGWLERAWAFLEAYPKVGVVCGRRRERHPEKSLYNLLCDIEWDTPVGSAKACGGDALMRVDAFLAAGGFRGDLIAGEEPELCIRLRASGWSVWRIDEEMTLHDAAITRFGQWWMRTMRGGYAFAEGLNLHGAGPERYRLRETRSIWLWGCLLPTGIVLAVLLWGGWAALLIGIYPLQIARLCLQGRRDPRENCVRAVFVVLGKFPEMAGQVKYLLRRWSGSDARLIEYK